MDGSWQNDTCDDAEQAISCETITNNGETNNTGGAAGPGTPILCNGLVASIVGTDGDDVIEGTWQDDVIVGLGGNDTINGASGADTICGGHGDDTINGGSQADTIAGEDGDDTINGGSGDDSLDGGEGTDIVDGSWQADACDDAETALACEVVTNNGEATQSDVRSLTSIAQTGTEVSLHNGDGSLVLLQQLLNGKSTTELSLVWDPMLSVPEVVGLGSESSVYGYEREFIGGDGLLISALGDQTRVGRSFSNASPFGASEQASGVQFGYRGELVLLASVYLRNRVLDGGLESFNTRDPLAGVWGTASLSSPYHYAANDPIGFEDPLGLRPTDSGMAPGGSGFEPFPGADVSTQQSRGPVPVPPATLTNTGRALKGFTAAAVVIGLIDSWPTDQEVNEQLARMVFPQLRDASEVENSRGVFTQTKAGGYDCGSESLAATAENGGGDVLASALLLGRQAVNADGIAGTEDGQTTAAAVWCIDGVAGSLLGRQASGDKAPDGFATVSRSSVNSVMSNSSNFHAETNVLETVSEVVRPRPGLPPIGSLGYLVIAADRPVCNLCKGKIRQWSAQYPGIVVITVDPERVVGYVAGVDV